MTPPRPTDLGLERTASAYDQTPYRSIAHTDTRPAHLAAIAHLLGVATAAVATARVLEIGCAGGGNLIPMAAAFPEGCFIGIDLSPVQIDQGSRRAAATGLGNIEFRCASVTDVDQAWGTFDYIICHGVYSWVPAEVRRAILRVTAERLADDGLALVSYNVLPGWHLKRVAREAMLLHAGQLADPAQQIARSRAILDLLKNHASRETPYGRVVQAEASFLAEQRDDYLLHDYLEADNNPCTVLDFLAAAGSAGLAYLADSDTVLPEAVGAGLAGELRLLAGNHLPRLEHYLDLLIGRTFRQSILMKSAANTAGQRVFDPARFASLHVSVSFASLPGSQAIAPFVFAHQSGKSVTVESAVAARALSALSVRWPNSATAEELTDLVLADDSPRDAAVTAICEALLQLMQEGVLVLSAVPVRVGGAETACPVAWPLARVDAAQGARDTANQQHLPVELDAVSRALLPLMDGTRDRAALAEQVTAMVRVGVVTLRHDGKPIDDPRLLRALADRIVDGCVRSLASAGLLTA